jgi:predicted DNA-binding transcriptional regulator AlpA
MVSHFAMLQALYGPDTGSGGRNLIAVAPAQRADPKSPPERPTLPAGSRPDVNPIRGPPAVVNQIDPLLNSRQVANACGPVSMTTLWRWHQDQSIGFPEPDALIYSRRYWRLSTINQWLSERAPKAKLPSAAPSTRKHIPASGDAC